MNPSPGNGGRGVFTAVRHGKAPQQIIHQIRALIMEGRLRPGDRLASEQELTTEFGVSRQTLREAMRALEHLGLLEIRAGASGGAFVSEVGLETTFDSLVNFLRFKDMSVRHLSEVRKVVEPYVAEVAARRMSEENLARLAEIQAACRDALAAGDSRRLLQSEVRFHRTIGRCTGNPILMFIQDFIENLLEDVKAVLPPDLDFLASVVQAHQDIFQAIADRDPERAFREMYTDVSKVEEELIRLAEASPDVKWP